jgi:hypothetical protein
VAIRSTFKRLTECFLPSEAGESGMEHTVLVGRVLYADYDKDWIPEGNSLWPFVYKRTSFEFENEVRAVIQDFPMVEDPQAEGRKTLDLNVPSPPGKLVAVDLNTLIDEIRVSPIAPSWFSDLVVSVCARYEVDKPVTQSSLAGPPVY